MVGGTSRIAHKAILCAAALQIPLAVVAPSFAADLAAPKELPVAAQAASVPIDLAFGVRFQSDYNFRGVTQSNHKPSPQSYLELQLFDNLVYLGYANERVDLPTRPQVEQDLTFGIRPKLGPLNFDFGVIQYWYVSERRLVDYGTGTIYSPRNTDFTELAAKVSYTYAEALTVGANVFYSWNYLGTKAPGTYVSGTAKYVIPENTFGFMPSGFSISGEFGHYFLGTTSSTLGFTKLPEYNYGNIGVSYNYKFATLDVRFHDTDLGKRKCFTLTGDPDAIASGSGRSNWCGSAVVATLSFDFTASQLGSYFEPTPVAAPR